MRKLLDKVAIVTGAAAGIGKEIAIEFARHGAKVVAADINLENLEFLKNEIHEFGGEITTFRANMSSEIDIDMMIDTAIEVYGTLDILVNNAGIMDRYDPVGEVTNETYEKVMKINVEGPFKAIRKALSIFVPQKKGVIINMCSVAGLNAGRSGPIYTMSKHALVGLTKNTGYQYAKLGIRSNAIAPGDISTNIADSLDLTKLSPMIQDRVFPGFALSARSGQPSEIAKVALFLASDDASYINGTVLVADGGWSAY